MTGLNESTLARMRTQFAGLLPDVCTLLEPQRVADGAGGVTTTYVPVAGGVDIPCRLDPLFYRVSQTEVGGMEVTTAHFLLTVAHDAPLEAEQRVVFSGATYRVLTLADMHSWRVARRAYVLRYD
jgi:hypothetical protein